MGPIAGTLASRLGYRHVLRLGLIGTIIGLVLLFFVVGTPTPLATATRLPVRGCHLRWDGEYHTQRLGY